MAVVGSALMFSDAWLDKEENGKLADFLFRWLLPEGGLEVRATFITLRMLLRTIGVTLETGSRRIWHADLAEPMWSSWFNLCLLLESASAVAFSKSMAMFDGPLLKSRPTRSSHGRKIIFVPYVNKGKTGRAKHDKVVVLSLPCSF